MNKINNIVRKRHGGFSFIAISIIMIFIGLVIYGTISEIVSEGGLRKTQSTKQKLYAIENAINDFIVKEKRLPCPASLTEEFGSAAYGTEQFVTNACDSSGAGIFDGLLANGAENLIYGAVPVRTLGLKDSYGVDEWGGKLSYVIDNRFASKTLNLETDSGFAYNISDDIGITGDIVVDSTTNVLFLVLSHGRDKKGSYQAFGSGVYGAGDPNFADAGNFNATFTVTGVNIDDLAIFGTKNEIQDRSFSVGTGAYKACICDEKTYISSPIALSWDRSRCGETAESKEICPSSVIIGVATSDYYYLSASVKNKPSLICQKDGNWLPDANMLNPCLLLPSCSTGNLAASYLGHAITWVTAYTPYAYTSKATGTITVVINEVSMDKDVFSYCTIGSQNNISDATMAWTSPVVSNPETECDAITTGNANSGYATWAVGTVDSTETATACIPGYTENVTLPTRDCTYIGWDTVTNPCIVGIPSDMELWLDASDEGTITKDGSNDVSAWNDKSGNENHVTQVTSSYQPDYVSSSNINGYPAIRFNGSEYFNLSAFESPAAHTKFIVFKSDSSASAQRIIFYSKVGEAAIFGDNLVIDNGILLSNTNYVHQAITLGSFIYNGTSSEIYVNGGNVITGDGGSNSGTYDFTVGQGGGTWYYSGDIAEVIVYNRVLDSAEIEDVEAYLMDKWGVIPTNDRVLWLDANDESTITKDGDNKVSTWSDKSGNGNNATQGTSTYQPTYLPDGLSGKGTIYFDATDDRMATSLNLSSPYSVFVVFNYKSSVSAARRAIRGDTNNWLIGPYTNTIDHYAGGWVSNSFSLTQNTFYVTSAINTGSASTFYIDGVNNTQNSGYVTPPGIVSLGASSSVTEPLDGDIAEVIIYNRALSDTERQEVENYLNDKWMGCAAINDISSEHGFARWAWSTDADNPVTGVCPSGYQAGGTAPTRNCVDGVWQTVSDPCVAEITTNGISMWFDPSDSNNITLDGSNITNVTDISGNINNLEQTTESKQPAYSTSSISGLNSILNATGDGLLGPNLGSGIGYTDITLFIIMQTSTSTSGTTGYIFSKDGSGVNTGDFSIEIKNDKASVTDQPNGIFFDGANTVTDGNPHLITFRLNSDKGYLLKTDGITRNSDSTTGNTIWNNSTLLELGAVLNGSYAYRGNIGETILYTKALSDSQIEDVEAYLMNKWGVTESNIPMYGLKLWLDAEDIDGDGDTTDNPADSSDISTWSDKSGNGNHATQATSTKQPLYSTLNNVIAFDGSSDELEVDYSFLNSNTSYTVIIVEGRKSGKESNYPIGCATYATNEALHFGYRYNTTFRFGQYYNDVDGTVPAYTSQKFNIMIGLYDNFVGHFLCKNGTELASNSDVVGFITIRPGRIGSNFGSNFYDGDIAEVIMYNRALSDVERQEVEAYLSDKWGINSSPPSAPTSNATVWIDPSKSSNVTLNGSSISGISDISGNNNNFAQATSSKQPVYSTSSINSLNSILNATGDGLLGPNLGSGSGYTDITIFQIIQTSTSNSNGYTFSKDASGTNVGDASLKVLSDKAHFINQYHGVTVNGTTSVNDGNPHLMTFRLSSSTGYSLYVDGMKEANNTTTGNTIWNNSALSELGAVLDGGYAYQGNIGETILYTEALSISEMDDIETHLSNKWGVTMSDIPTENLRLWFDANDVNTITKDGSNNVSAWNDKSGNGNHATQATFSYKPVYVPSGLNGKGTIRFDGTDDRMATSLNLSSPPYSVFVVFNYLNLESAVPSAVRRAVQGSNNWLIGPYSSQIRHYAGGWVSYSLPLIQNTFYVTSAINTGSGSTFYINGANATDSSTPVTAPGTIHLGAGGAYPGEPLDGDIAEVIIYDRALSDSERREVESYLSNKWGVAAIPTSGLTLWLDADDESTITFNGSTVSGWEDKSGNGNNVIQTTASSQPTYVVAGLNNRAVLSFDGSDTLSKASVSTLSLFSQNETTMFIVNKQDFAQSSTPFVWNTGVGGRVSIHNPWGDGIIYWDAPITSGRIYQGGHSAKTNWAVWGFVKESNTASRVYYNGSSLFSGTYTSSPIPIASAALDFGESFTGDIAEVIVYNRALNSAEIDAVEAYLADKWGL
ncbi:LamG-like jellyroll fold domain-containing protein [Pseudomonadota bacterium]